MNPPAESKEEDKWKKEKWYLELIEEAKYIFDLINKYHGYFSSQDKKYRKVVRTLKLIVLIITMSSTIVLGLKTVIEIHTQVDIGLILSALITFMTAILAYFNFEEYWMRNITTHIELNIMRDDFVLDAKAKRIDEKKVKEYRTKLEGIQTNNIRYWEKAIKRI